MKKVVLSVIAAIAVSASSAFAADMPVKATPAPAAAPSMWDVAFGTALTSDYVLRGVSQSNRKVAEQGYFEPRFTINNMIQLYAGVWGSSLYGGFADAEIDIYAGARFTFGNFGLDVGYIYYDYPDGTINGNGSFGDFYAKPSYKFNDWLTVGAAFDYGDNFNNGLGIVGSKVDGYYSVNAVVTLPWNWNGVTVAFNPEVGRQFVRCTGCVSFDYWDVGVDFMYKAATLDLRYWSTSASGSFLSPVAYGSTNLSGPKFVATLKFDTTLAALK